MLNHRLAALLVFITLVILPAAIDWMMAPGVNWLRPYVIWAMVVLATWMWQKRRRNQ